MKIVNTRVSPPLFDAALNGQAGAAGRAYFFRAGGYRQYNWSTDRLDDGGSLPLFALHLPGEFRDGVDAAFNGRGAFARYAYFTRGPQYVQYDWTTNRVTFGPVPTALAWGLPLEFAAGVDTALEGEGAYAGKAYFFRGNDYVRYDFDSGVVDYRGTLVEWGLPSQFAEGVNAAVNGSSAYAGKAYFFSNDPYVRYDWATGRIDQKLTDVASIWPALLGLRERPTRRVVPYVTIDIDDHKRQPDRNHQPNLDGLRAAAAGFDASTYVDDRWSREVDARVLADPHLLGLFLAGSFDEWIEIYQRLDWTGELHRFGELVRGTHVPTLAVCGSHQLVAATFAGWGNVGHMTPAGRAPRPISAEADGTSRIPKPRLGEVGVFPTVLSGLPDPLLADLPAQQMFAEYHHDAVLAPPPSSRQILVADGLTGADQSRAVAAERDQARGPVPGAGAAVRRAAHRPAAVRRSVPPGADLGRTARRRTAAQLLWPRPQLLDAPTRLTRSVRGGRRSGRQRVRVKTA
jgi:hypothetical protein